MVTWEGCGQPVCTVLTPSTFHSDLPSPCHYSTKSYAFFLQPYPSRRTFAQPFTPSSPLTSPLTPSPHLSPPYLTSHPLTSLSSTSLHLQANSTYPKFSPGYLSLHNQQRGGGLELKWIPIDLLNCNQEDPEAEPAIRCTTLTHGGVTSTSVLCVCRAWLPALFRSLATLHTCLLAMYQL